jgi:hypothetical protein
MIDAKEIKVNHLSPIPAFVTFVFPTYTFAPKIITDLGLFIIKGEI